MKDSGLPGAGWQLYVVLNFHSFSSYQECGEVSNREENCCYNLILLETAGAMGK